MRPRSSPHSDSPKKLGEAVRELRAAQDWTQMELAEKADLTLTYIGEIERGEKTPSLDTIQRVGKAFGLSASDLLRKAGL